MDRHYAKFVRKVKVAVFSTHNCNLLNPHACVPWLTSVRITENTPHHNQNMQTKEANKRGKHEMSTLTFRQNSVSIGLPRQTPRPRSPPRFFEPCKRTIHYFSRKIDGTLRA